MSDRIRVLIVDDHAVVREGLRALIETQPDMTLVGEAANGEEAVEKSQDIDPDVVLMDLVMPRKSGIEATNDIQQAQPEVRVLVLTSFAEDDKVFPAIQAGAMGYLLKDASPRELLEGIREVYRGEPTMHPTVARRLMREIKTPSQLPPTPEPLSEREAEVLALVARGLSNQEIADQLYISEKTVRTHVSHILTKLHLANRTQAALYALRKGIADLEDIT
jgi:two-component system, NarL family, response regulator LiaR